ncbi:MAG: Glutamyl-Q tRNA(Asp) synthetase [Hydrocarboniphaga sp.]|uniref:tRNA glutamyl-Q(34) synthetase GluQRS n=1 Tax=Hydrocarboniphaga sp. TaxID=2033016 RepID=UPI00262B8856|nr:tRNA glutamyl-Q(34) synthetase GluQRS [Hydrocarboniphaga sp.]MDB5970756.1 Glutamyl-Q tRNA(Asp) synthetase [Hydrocarboniphaga sp.]
MSRYRGRFAPTPSGPLHLGSLLTALASYVDARRNLGHWLLRIDDLDTQRINPGAEAEILRQLETHGLHWDGAIRRQSRHVDDYRAALDALMRQKLIYRCDCSRAVLAQTSLPGLDGAIYPGTCRNRQLQGADLALRVRLPDEELSFEDAGQGLQRRNLEMDIGDFVVRRRDGGIAYQLACAIDEHSQGITNVVRGADLLGSTFMQQHLMQQLRLRAPRYRHLPVLVDSEKRKFSKQNHSLAIATSHASANLLRCLSLLGQSPPPALAKAAPREILAWAVPHWVADSVPRRPSIEMRTL